MMVDFPISLPRFQNGPGRTIRAEHINEHADALEDLGQYSLEGDIIIGGPGGIPTSMPVESVPVINRLQLGVTRKNLRAEGFALDGSDEGAAMAAMAAADSPGVIYVIPDGATLGMGSTQLAITGKPHTRIEGYEGATMQWTSAAITTPLIAVTSSDHFGIDTVAIQGAETGFIGADSSRYALDISACDRVMIRNLVVSGTSRGMRLNGSNNATVDGFDYTGLVTGFVAGVNFHSGLFVNNSHDGQFSHVRARDCGSGILVGSTSQRGTVSHFNGRNTYDNGIYVSSGIGWQVILPVVIMDVIGSATNTGVKFRGSNNTCLGGYVYGTGTGYSLTGAGITLDADGANGNGSALIGVQAINTNTIGAEIQSDGNGPPRDMAIVDGYFDGCGQDGGLSSASIRVLSGDGHTISRNRVMNPMGTGPAAILIVGATGDHIEGISVTHNKVKDTRDFVSAYALQTSFMDNSVIGFNEFKNIGPTSQYATRLIDSSNNRIVGNRRYGTHGTIATFRINDAASTGNVFIDNIGCTLSDLGTGTIKPQTYAATNVTTDRTFDADTVAVAELADIVGTLIADLRGQGVVV